ncbi:unnamed protein product [Peronospora destructor]|uniref:Uncharacterized protein n=1 Tax=Peronospora destructor TaxID=86335 RepID=A0AAV0VB73_9STRA|nr:unnamed protein product [Peronospora destructor]
MSDCPTATNEQKDAARTSLRERSTDRVASKRAAVSQVGEGLTAILTESLEVSLCVDSDSDTSIIPYDLLQELPSTAYSITKLKSPVKVRVVGGAKLIAKNQVSLDVQVRAAAGPVKIRGVKCLVLEESEDQFILGKDVLSSLGIDVSTMIEQLAASTCQYFDADDLNLPVAEVGADSEEGILVKLAELRKEAEKEDREDIGLCEDLYTCV